MGARGSKVLVGWGIGPDLERERERQRDTRRAARDVGGLGLDGMGR